VKPGILGVGDYRPARVLTNEDLAATLDTTDRWIRHRTGIQSRHIAAADETVVFMASEAAAKALAQAGVAPDAIDLVLLATCTLPSNLPGGAAAVAHALGTTRAGALDINAACAGFCYGLALAADVVRGGARHVLVVASERLSDWVDWTDRSTSILFGDGAGAAVIGTNHIGGIGPVVWGHDGARQGAIEIVDGTIRMQGPQVYRWATTELTAVARQACLAAGVAPAELAAFVPHQANLRIIESLARDLAVPQDRVARDVVGIGNTSAASVPLALTQLRADGRVSPGEPVLLLGFGAGLTFAGQVVACP
jgi:3-oxoacyl-[acyl-carrier-protein] synthase-3